MTPPLLLLLLAVVLVWERWWRHCGVAVALAMSTTPSSHDSPRACAPVARNRSTVRASARPAGPSVSDTLSSSAPRCTAACTHASGSATRSTVSDWSSSASCGAEALRQARNVAAVRHEGDACGGAGGGFEAVKVSVVVLVVTGLRWKARVLQWTGKNGGHDLDGTVCSMGQVYLGVWETTGPDVYSGVWETTGPDGIIWQRTTLRCATRSALPLSPFQRLGRRYDFKDCRAQRTARRGSPPRQRVQQRGGGAHVGNVTAGACMTRPRAHSGRHA
eukprot:355903-Chlamydomonas_euryale.AAC.19